LGIHKPIFYHLKNLNEYQHKTRHASALTITRFLLKTNEIVNDAEAKKRLAVIAGRIADGDDFAALAQANSDDTGSALKGGDLGWVMPGLLVPPFEQAMNEYQHKTRHASALTITRFLLLFFFSESHPVPD
jgi:peptidyl-prolyl cis-trans isomerase SurA